MIYRRLILLVLSLCEVVSIVRAEEIDYGRRADSLGFRSARALCEMTPCGGKVALFRNKIDDPFSERLFEAMLCYLQSERRDVEILVSDYHTGGNATSALRITLPLLRRMGGLTTTLFGASSSALLGLLRAVDSLGISPALVGIADSDVDSAAIAARVDRSFILVRDRADSLSPALVAAFGGQHVDFIDRSCAAQSPLPSAVELSPSTLFADSILVSPCSGVELVRVDNFYIGRFELLQREWCRVMDADPSRYVDQLRPVDNVSWSDAVEFCARLTAAEHACGALPSEFEYRLPYEREWNMAACADDYQDLLSLDSTCRHRGNSFGLTRWGLRMATHRGGTMCANRFGIYDMTGNLNEWCADCVSNTGATPKYLLKGGCWWADPWSCLPSKRHSAPSTRHHSALGFRVVLTKRSVYNR